MTAAPPRLLVIMGSGETAPTMKNPHRRVFDRLEAAIGRPPAAVMLDTPFGFQENAEILAATSIQYFGDTVGRTVEPAGLFRTDSGDVVGVESAIARIRRADWVFAGPGSPTFALAQWKDTPVPDALAAKLRDGGAVVFSSAAALTLGVVTVPVYEVYKVGQAPHWLEGLNLLATVGINAAVIPHYDNNEGGNHDTRYCYLGERRLSQLEPELPDGAFVLGVDEHTGVIIDLDAETAEVVGKGGLTLRRDGSSVVIPSGETVALDVLRSGGADLDAEPAARPAPTESPEVDTSPAPVEDSLEGAAKRLEAAFDDALADRDADAAVAAVLELEQAIVEWSADTLQSDQVGRARTAMRSMIVRLGQAATEGVRDPRQVLGPVVQAALDARRVAREEKAYAVSDAVRDGLVAAGIEVRDTPDGVEWHIVD